MHASVTGRPPIPAMTTDAERECYYRLAREAAGRGSIIELGAWLGASTAYIAAGLRDSLIGARVHVYDAFVSKPAHAAKVKTFYDREGIDPIPVGDARAAFEAYLGPALLPFVDVHQGRIEQIVDSEGPIALLVTDAPKRVPEISGVLTRLTRHIVPGTIMAWQDFCHFPSYEIPACLYRLRDHLEVVEAVVPGTTVVFRVTSPWAAGAVSREALTPKRWSPAEIEQAWTWWQAFVPADSAARFQCGAALFLSDIGHPATACALLNDLLARDAESILPKWRYLKAVRPDLVTRYQQLFELLENRGVL